MANENEVDIEKIKLVDLFDDLISKKKYAEFVESINKKSKNELNYEAWELTPKLCRYIHPKSKPKLLNTCTLVLNHLASVCDPKDLLLIFIEQINDSAKLKDTLFLNLLDPLFTCVRRIEYPKSQALGLAFKDLYKRISYLDLPKEYELENKERQLLEFDTTVQTILKWLVPFQNRVEDLLMNSLVDIKHISNKKKEVCEFMKLEINILSRPLAYFDLSHEKEIKSGSRNVAESCLKVLHSLQSDTVKLLSFFASQNEMHALKKSNKDVDKSEEDKEKPFAERGCATLAYLVFGENLTASSFPCIYTSQFLFEFNAPHYLHLLQETNSLLIYKGLQLCTNLLKKLGPSVWEHEFLEWSPIIDLLKSLMFIGSSTKLQEFQKWSLQLIASIVKAFKVEARSKLYHFLLSRCPRKVVIGFVITLFKGEIEDGLKEKNDKIEIAAKPLKHLNLEKLYQIIFSLPRGEKSDLIEYAEQIMGALNLLRFLMEADPSEKENKTGIWNILPLIENKYFTVLGSGIELSRSHYRLQIKKIRDARSERAAAGLPLEESNQKLSGAHQVSFLEKAIHTFDLMEEVLGKVSGLVKSSSM